MSKPSLIYYEILRYQPENLRLLEEKFEVFRLKDPREDREDNLRMVEVILAPLGYYLGKGKIDLAPHLRVIGSNTTGHPHIDVEYAEKRGIRVVTLKGQDDFLRTITPTAELTWGLVIALTRNMFPAAASVLNGKWDRRPFGGRAMLSRMSLGVAGYGRLGKMVAWYGKCFGMKVRYFDPFVDQMGTEIERVDSLERLVDSSDIVTIHIPHERETENLFNRKVLSGFRKGAFLVNTSRGELVDHWALLECLENKTLAGAALDVLDGEFAQNFYQKVKEHPLVKYAKDHSNLIFTPHIGGSTTDAWRETEAYTINEILKAMGM